MEDNYMHGSQKTIRDIRNKCYIKIHQILTVKNKFYNTLMKQTFKIRNTIRNILKKY